MPLPRITRQRYRRLASNILKIQFTIIFILVAFGFAALVVRVTKPERYDDKFVEISLLKLLLVAYLVQLAYMQINHLAEWPDGQERSD